MWLGACFGAQVRKEKSWVENEVFTLFDLKIPMDRTDPSVAAPLPLPAPPRLPASRSLLCSSSPPYCAPTLLPSPLPPAHTIRRYTVACWRFAWILAETLLLNHVSSPC